MGTVAFDPFYKNYVKALHDGNAAIFAGAGLSRACGYVDWRGLLREIAEDLGLDIDQETDLIAVAQYHENKYRTRTQLNRAIIEEFTKHAKLSESHRLIAGLPIDTVWTTNYDKLIETAFKEAGRIVDTKITSTDLANPCPWRAVTIYKMHGDISRPNDAVLTKDDYETYDFPHKRELFSIKLKGDLVGKMFLFLGFSFTDPNIDHILGRIRALLGTNIGQHYCIMRGPAKPRGKGGKAKARYEYEKTKMELRISDLNRYGIRALMIDEYDQLTDILREINHRSHLKDIFLSGSAYSYDPMSRDRIENLVRLIGRNLIESGLNIVTGVGAGLGEYAVLGAMEAIYTGNCGDQADRLSLRPFPQKAPRGIALADFWHDYRKNMIAKAGACIFLCGNKQDTTGKVVEADGVLKEFDIALSLKKYPIPIGATGHAARRIWEVVTSKLDVYFPHGGVKGYFQVLGDKTKSDTEIVNAIFGILKQIKAI